MQADRQARERRVRQVDRIARQAMDIFGLLIRGDFTGTKAGHNGAKPPHKQTENNSGQCGDAQHHLLMFRKIGAQFFVAHASAIISLPLRQLNLPVPKCRTNVHDFLHFTLVTSEARSMVL